MSIVPSSISFFVLFVQKNINVLNKSLVVCALSSNQSRESIHTSRIVEISEDQWRHEELIAEGGRYFSN